MGDWIGVRVGVGRVGKKCKVRRFLINLIPYFSVRPNVNISGKSSVRYIGLVFVKLTGTLPELCNQNIYKRYPVIVIFADISI